MIESKPPPGANRPGGNATALDWSILAGWQPALPWILAGGLTPENVARGNPRLGRDGGRCLLRRRKRARGQGRGAIRDFITASRNAGAALPAARPAEYESTDQGVP